MPAPAEWVVAKSLGEREEPAGSELERGLGHHSSRLEGPSMPFELYLLWKQYPWDFGELVCDAKMVTTETVTYSSIFTIVAFTVERYMAICHPLNIPRKSKMTRAIRALVTVWVVSVAFSLPWVYYNKVNYLHDEVTGEVLYDSAWCAVPWNVELKTPLYLMIASTTAAFIVPFSIVTLLYFQIGLAMKRSSSMHRNATSNPGSDTLDEAQLKGPSQGTANNTDSTLNRGRTTVIRMLVAVVLVFFVCWTPFHAQRLMFVTITLQGTWTETNGMAHHVLFLLSGIGYYLSSSVNPLLYSVMSKRFRRGFVDMMPFLRGRFSQDQLPEQPHMHDSLPHGTHSGSGRLRTRTPMNGNANRYKIPKGRSYPVRLLNDLQLQAPGNNKDPLTLKWSKKSDGSRSSSDGPFIPRNGNPCQNRLTPELETQNGGKKCLEPRNRSSFAPIITSTSDAQMIARWVRRPAAPAQNNRPAEHHSLDDFCQGMEAASGCSY